MYIYVKRITPDGSEYLYSCTNTVQTKTPHQLIMDLVDGSQKTLDILNGDAIYIMTHNGETMSSIRTNQKPRSYRS